MAAVTSASPSSVVDYEVPRLLRCLHDNNVEGRGIMSAADYLGAYAEGWTNGDADKIIGSVSDGFVLDDPNAGKIGKADFANYLVGMKEAVASMRGENYSGPFMELTEVTTREEGGVLTAWCWWSIPDTALRGAGLIKVGDSGVQSERLTYYTKLPE